MSYQRERDEFIAKASSEGLDLPTITKLLRYASTLQRLAVAQCNGDWPYNGGRDRPSCSCAFIDHQHGDSCAKQKAWFDALYTVCPKCGTSGVRKSAMRSYVTVERTDEGKVKYRERHTMCPDCRTQELVRALLPVPREVTCPSCNGDGIGKRDSAAGVCNRCIGTKLIRADMTPIFQGDPRGAVLRLATPGYPWSDDGSKGYGLYVPARGTR